MGDLGAELAGEGGVLPRAGEQGRPCEGCVGAGLRVVGAVRVHRKQPLHRIGEAERVGRFVAGRRRRLRAPDPPSDPSSRRRRCRASVRAWTREGARGAGRWPRAPRWGPAACGHPRLPRAIAGEHRGRNRSGSRGVRAGDPAVVLRSAHEERYRSRVPRQVGDWAQPRKRLPTRGRGQSCAFRLSHRFAEVWSGSNGLPPGSPGMVATLACLDSARGTGQGGAMPTASAIVNVALPEIEARFVLSGLEVLAEQWEATEAWLRAGEMGGSPAAPAVREGHDPDEAVGLAAEYRRVIAMIREQLPDLQPNARIRGPSGLSLGMGDGPRRSRQTDKRAARHPDLVPPAGAWRAGERPPAAADAAGGGGDRAGGGACGRRRRGFGGSRRATRSRSPRRGWTA